MNVSIWICCFICFAIALYSGKKETNYMISKVIKYRRKERDKGFMTELIKRFLDKECIINTVNANYTGIVKEVSDGGVLLDNRGNLEVINIEFITHIKEYPLNKNGRKKMFVNTGTF